MLTNCLLVLLLQQGFDYEQVEKVGLLDVRLVTGLVVGVSFQLELTLEMISLFDEYVLNIMEHLADMQDYC